MKLFTDNEGRVLSVDGPPPPGATFNGGLAFDSQGRVYSANIQPDDVFVGGMRVSQRGELVETDAAGQVPGEAYVAGLPVANAGAPPREGAVLRQVDTIPAPNDPFVAGVRVGPLGGMYQTTL